MTEELTNPKRSTTKMMMVDQGWCDLDTWQGIVITILLGPIRWTAALIQEMREEIEATITGRMSGGEIVSWQGKCL